MPKEQPEASKVTIDLLDGGLVLNVEHGDPGPDAIIWNDGSNDRERKREMYAAHNDYLPSRICNVPRSTADILVKKGRARIVDASGNVEASSHVPESPGDDGDPGAA